jgi:integrase
LKTFQALSDQRSEAPSLSDSLETYLRLKGSSKGKIFEQSAKRSVGLAISIIEDKQLTGYSTSDATKLRDHMLLNGLKVATVKRNLSTLRSIVNLNKTELGLDFSNPFTGIFLPDLNDAKVRNPIPESELTSIQQECLHLDDEQRRIIALLSDTGMRLSETLGLLVEDIKIDTVIPHIVLTPHPWRRIVWVFI